MTNLSNKTSYGVKYRIIFDLVILVAVFFTPWWIVAILAFISAFIYPLYLEFFIFGILLDILYGASAFPLGGVYGILGAAAIFSVTMYLKSAIR